MQNKHLCKIWMSICSIGIMTAACINVSAEGPYNNYTYDAFDKSVPTAAGYLPDSLITGDSLGVGAFNNPKDIYYDNASSVYILDAGNKRFVVLSSVDLKVKKVITPTDKDGKAFALSEPTGIFVTANGDIYVADKSAKQVYIFSAEGRLKDSIGCPKTDLLPDGFDYKPSKVAVDSNGVTYVISYGCYSGALQFDSKHNFIGFYGSESVTMTAQLVLQKMWAKIMPKSMSAEQSRAVPVNYNNFDIDSKDMIYTTRNDVDTNVGQVRKLNYYGNNLLIYQTSGRTRTYGDIETYYDVKNGKIQSIISDVDVDPQGFFTILDTRRNRIFQFDKDSNLLFSFGGTSSQFGCFLEASAIETIGDKILVLDDKYNSLTVFHTTAYGKLVRKASSLLSDGQYSKCKEVCLEILKYDSNLALANIGVGKAYQAEGNYKESLDYFYKANDAISYSNSYYEFRYAVLKDIFVYIVIGIVVLFMVLIILAKIRKKKKLNDVYRKISKYKYPFYVMRHPLKGHYMLKEDKSGSVKIASVIVFLFFVVNIFVRQNTNFLFSGSRSEDFNIAYTFVSTVGLFVVMTVCNWALGTLMDGEGKFKDIWISFAYALMPYVICMIPLTIISNVLVNDESIFFYAATYIVYAWVFIGILMAIRDVHQFTMWQTVLALGGTVLGMVIVAALYAMAYSMLSQLISFLVTIFGEILMRI